MSEPDNHTPPTEETPSPPFWKVTALAAMNREQWESLCDGCGRCCLEKLQDWWTGAVTYTNIACRLLDTSTCRCRHYADRRRHVRKCEHLTAANVGTFDWLPDTCAYRLVAAGRDLPWWHHLVSGDPELVHRVGVSVRDQAVPPRTAEVRDGRFDERRTERR